MTKPSIVLGTGIYTRAEAAHLLGVTPSRLRRWVGGYTYRYRYQTTDDRRHRPAVVRPELPVLGREVALSFIELMELRVVKALIDRGISLQHVRAAARLASECFQTAHPFASRRVFTDGRSVFAALAKEPDSGEVVELSRKAIHQIVAGRIFEPFLEEIDFDERTALAERWWPLGRAVPVVLDPRVAFGAPTVAGTRIRTNVLAGVALRTTPEETADAYRIAVDRVLAAVEFEAHLAAA